MIDRTDFRNAMARLGGAVAIITTDGPSGRAGFTATAVCSVTDTPPTLLVCQNRTSYTHGFFTGNGTLCVNLLSAEQQALSGVFADRSLDDAARFSAARWSNLETGSPALDHALVNFDCQIEATQVVGTHAVFFCAVVAIRTATSGAGLVYFDRTYHHLTESSRARA